MKKKQYTLQIIFMIFLSLGALILSYLIFIYPQFIPIEKNTPNDTLLTSNENHSPHFFEEKKENTEFNSNLFIKDIQNSISAEKFMVSTANPFASQAALEILKQGGNAIDAMIAAQSVLGLVEPQSSGLGGGSFLVYYDKSQNKTFVLDGREIAPSKTKENLFLNSQGMPLNVIETVGGQSVAIPGTVKLLEEAQKRWGTKNLLDNFQFAIALAQNGFQVSERLSLFIKNYRDHLHSNSLSKKYFFLSTGEEVPPGFLLKNKAYAKTLQIIGEKKMDGFYSGEIGKSIVEAVQNSTKQTNVLSQEDLLAYNIIERDPVCFFYNKYKICGVGAPSSGILTLGQILMMLESFKLSSYDFNNEKDFLEIMLLIGQASQLAFADSDVFVADPDFIQERNLLDPMYIFNRSREINFQYIQEILPGNPPLKEPQSQENLQSYFQHEGVDIPSTTHISIVDAQGNTVAMSSTIEGDFGSGIMTSSGFLLNNEMTDFSFLPEKNGNLVANRIEPGKRPRSFMAPLLIFDEDGNFYMSLGSSGGSRIIGYLLKTLILHFDGKMDLQESINFANFLNMTGTYNLEKDEERFYGYEILLEKLGYKVEYRDLNSGLHGIFVKNNMLYGGVDKRREGIVLGE